jgi:hypothetical protein
MQIGAMRGWQTGVTISFPVTIMKRLPMHVLRPIPKCGRLHFMIPETFDIDRPRPIHGLSLRAIFFMLFGILVAMQAALWAFLAMPLWWSFVALTGCGAIGWAVWRAQWPGRVSAETLGVCLAVAFCLLLLGGEGRFFYANTDWQVRNAVLGDLARFSWPFAYDQPLGAKILRAPLGMYLLPALIGKWAGSYAAEVALLAQNTVMLALILALGSGLFPERRQRAIALGVFVGFSGMDVFGQILIRHPLSLHLEQWSNLQYSSHATQAFWVPQHAMTGWLFAMLYLLWLRKRAPAIALFAVMPLLALLSPLALMGCVPLAAHVFLSTAIRRDLTPGMILWPALAGAICLPGLLYLTANSGAVGAGGASLNWWVYGIFLTLEVGGYFYALRLTRRQLRFGGTATMLVVAMLAIIPLGRVGDSSDFIMRASIPALAILSVMMAAILAEDGPQDDRAAQRKARWLILVVLAVGLITPLGEIGRALMWPASPRVQCSYMGVVPGGAPTYVAPVSSLPKMIRPKRFTLVRPVEPRHCWDGPWPDGVTGRDSSIDPK